MRPITTKAAQIIALADLSGAGKLLDESVLHLFKNDFTPGDGSVIGDFDEADYVGYATALQSLFGAPFIGGDGLAQVAPPAFQFQPTANTTPNTIHGWYVTKAAAPTVVLYAKKLDEPVPLVETTDALIVQATFYYGL